MVVESYNLFFTSAVGVEVVGLGCVVMQSLVDLFVEYTPVATAPTVDGLLYVAYEEAIVSARESFEQEGEEIIPLHS